MSRKKGVDDEPEAFDLQADDPTPQEGEPTDVVFSINEPPGSQIVPPHDATGPLPPAVPLVLADIDPDSAPMGAGTFVLTVTGEGFDESTVIYFGDEEMATTFVSATSLTSDVTPVSAVAEVVDVEVQRGEELSDVLTFEFTAVAARRQAEKTKKPAKKKDAPRKKKTGRRY